GKREQTAAKCVGHARARPAAQPHGSGGGIGDSESLPFKTLRILLLPLPRQRQTAFAASDSRLLWRKNVLLAKEMKRDTAFTPGLCRFFAGEAVSLAESVCRLTALRGDGAAL